MPRKQIKWWRVSESEKRLIEFGWAWWDVPGRIIPNYYWYKAMEPFYRRYGVVDQSNHA